MSTPDGTPTPAEALALGGNLEPGTHTVQHHTPDGTTTHQVHVIRTNSIRHGTPTLGEVRAAGKTWQTEMRAKQRAVREAGHTSRAGNLPSLGAVWLLQFTIPPATGIPINRAWGVVAAVPYLAVVAAAFLTGVSGATMSTGAAVTLAGVWVAWWVTMLIVLPTVAGRRRKRWVATVNAEYAALTQQP